MARRSISFHASVAQWIEHRPPEPGAEVRFLSDAFPMHSFSLFAERTFVEHLYKESLLSCLEASLPDGFRLIKKDMLMNNGVIKEAVFVMDDEASGASPLVYLSPCLSKISSDEDVMPEAEKMLAMLLDKKASGKLTHDLFRCLDDARYAAEHIIFRLIGKERNEALLEKCPHRPFLDLMITCQLLLPDQDRGSGVTLIDKKILKALEMTEDELFQHAERNTLRLMGIRRFPLDAVMTENLSGCPDVEVLTNEASFYGASLMLYPSVLAETAERSGKDLVIIPSSVHELLLMPLDESTDIASLDEIIRSVNDTLLPEEILSSHVYLFLRKNGAVGMEGQDRNF